MVTVKPSRSERVPAGRSRPERIALPGIFYCANELLGRWRTLLPRACRPAVGWKIALSLYLHQAGVSVSPRVFAAFNDHRELHFDGLVV